MSSNAPLLLARWSTTTTAAEKAKYLSNSGPTTTDDKRWNSLVRTGRRIRKAGR